MNACRKIALAAMMLGWATYGTAQTAICPDGSYVDRGPCKICPDGKYIGAGGYCQITPKGDYVRGDQNSAPRITPNGSYVSGTSGGSTTLCPDGSYVAGTQCVLAPNGKYVGK